MNICDSIHSALLWCTAAGLSLALASGSAAAQEPALLGDGQGDAIDAVLAALEARDALLSGETAPADAMLSGEGWIYSGSPPCRAAARATSGRAAER